ncbi:hypothetical protein SAMN05444166_5114 [Singulisphaera sp. GP187]|nr:hypothetical protein SAMN05444166_5114 [Singulisphaera sp. GP187]
MRCTIKYDNQLNNTISILAFVRLEPGLYQPFVNWVTELADEFRQQWGERGCMFHLLCETASALASTPVTKPLGTILAGFWFASMADLIAEIGT